MTENDSNLDSLEVSKPYNNKRNDINVYKNIGREQIWLCKMSWTLDIKHF